jgi:hypothetical protein
VEWSKLEGSFVRPQPPFKGNRFPQTDYFFHSGRSRWGGYSGDDFSFPRHNLGREFLIEAARERAKEIAVLGVILLAAAWPMVAMIFEVVRFYKGRR